MIEVMVFVVLSTVTTGAAEKLICPPDSTTAPEPEANVMFPDASVPDTIIVPAVTPSERKPKFTASVVPFVLRVVMLAPTVAVPAVLVLHRLVVGAAHVPVAEPKPAVVPF